MNHSLANGMKMWEGDGNNTFPPPSESTWNDRCSGGVLGVVTSYIKREEDK
jgi:hypothetical protein